MSDIGKIINELADEWEVGGFDESTIYGEFASTVAQRYCAQLRADKRELVEGLERLKGEMKKPFDLVDWDGCYLIVHALITKHGES